MADGYVEVSKALLIYDEAKTHFPMSLSEMHEWYQTYLNDPVSDVFHEGEEVGDSFSIKFGSEG